MKESIEEKNTVKYKSKILALQIIKMYQYLTEEKREYILSKQVLRSGTSIGAKVKEGCRGQTTPDFYTKMNIALKEVSETEYWLELLHDSGYIDDHIFEEIHTKCQEIIRMLTSTCRTTSRKLNNSKNSLSTTH